jgi:cellulose synthase (UDP-forming)
MPIGVDGGIFLLHFVPYIALNFLAFEEIARGYGRSFLIEQYNMARFASFAWSTLGMFRIRTRFGVTAKKTSERSPMMPYLLPQLAVIGLNVAAIPVGILLFYSAGHLPQDGMWANVFWATINTGLALMVVRFTRRQGDNRRDEYRFHFPVAARLGGVLGTVDDLSPRGLSFYGAIGDPATGTRLPLVLYLPDGPLEAELEIRSAVSAEQGDARYTRLVGGSFHDLPLAEEQRIEQFLYGSNIQRELNRYQEDSLTPLQRLAWVPRSELPSAARYWASCEVSQPGVPVSQQIGLAGSLATKDAVELLVNQTLDSTHPLILQVHSRSGTRTLRAHVGAWDVLPTGGGTLYRYRMRLDASSGVMPGEVAVAGA